MRVLSLDSHLHGCIAQVHDIVKLGLEFQDLAAWPGALYSWLDASYVLPHEATTLDGVLRQCSGRGGLHIAHGGSKAAASVAQATATACTRSPTTATCSRCGC